MTAGRSFTVAGMRSRLAPWLLVVALLGVLVVRALGGGDSDGPVHARVLRVVDGDTIVARLTGGGTEHIRYIGVDTPEDVRPGVPVRCFSRRAARRNARLVAGRRVLLRFDAERRDKYGRLLAYVFAGRVFVNARLVAEGFARDYPFPPNTAHAGLMRRLRARAETRRRGLWGACGGSSFG